MVFFWAPWARPSRALGATVDEIARTYAGRIRVVKSNVDEEAGAAARSDVRGIPTIIIFKTGNPRARIVGAVPKQRITDAIDDVLAR